MGSSESCSRQLSSSKRPSEFSPKGRRRQSLHLPRRCVPSSSQAGPGRLLFLATCCSRSQAEWSEPLGGLYITPWRPGPLSDLSLFTPQLRRGALGLLWASDGRWPTTGVHSSSSSPIRPLWWSCGWRLWVGWPNGYGSRPRWPTCSRHLLANWSRMRSGQQVATGVAAGGKLIQRSRRQAGKRVGMGWER